MINYFHIISEGKVVASNLPDSHLNEFKECADEIKKVLCNVEKAEKRHGIARTPDSVIYLVSYDRKITNKIFKRYFEACIYFLPNLRKSKAEIKDFEEKNFRRLKHNLISHNTNILQLLYKLFPQDSLVHGSKNQVQIIREIITTKSNEAAHTILRVLKSANLMKSEFDVFDMINSDKPYLEFDRHSAHKITLLTLTPFWLDLIEKGVVIDIGKCHETVLVDYKSISVALCHLFDNATKYISPNTIFKIYFKNHPKEVDINLEMTSLKITDTDMANIFRDNYSGELATKLGKSGSGLGMNIVKRLVELNHGEISIKRNIESKQRIGSMIPFERNLFIIRLSK